MSIAIQVENLSKKYIIGHEKAERYTALRDVITNKAKNIFKSSKRASDTYTEEFYALKNLSFEIQQGDRVGIIGRNGAGKSTLLKILSRITEPTNGRIGLKGRVSSLLEVGTGFHPELTGRENIYLNGAILGMSRVEIRKKFDEIVDFSEVEKFLDTPVKRYSSGMYVRLAFAVAAHLEPEILIVDEVLAVGDVQFQQKCLGKMEDVSKNQGRTVLFVSHNMGAIKRLCNYGIYLNKGVCLEGKKSIEETVLDYLTKANHIGNYMDIDEPLDKPISLLNISILNLTHNEKSTFDINDEIAISINYRVNVEISGANVSLAIKNSDSVMVFRTWDIDQDQSLFLKRKPGFYNAKIKIPKMLLNTGTYTIYLATGQPGKAPISIYDDILTFKIEAISVDYSHKSFQWGGLIVLPLNWETTLVNN